jgi:hypothetical protein
MSISVAFADINNEEGLESVHKFLERVPNLREIVKLRSSLLPQNIIDLSSRLTRGEDVDPSEIRRVNEG